MRKLPGGKLVKVKGLSKVLMALTLSVISAFPSKLIHM